METEETNLELLYKYANIVLEEKNKGYPTGEITEITIQDTYGTTIKIKIKK